MRARCTIEEIRKDREAIVVTEIPYQVNKATMIEKIAELVREKKIEGIAELRDESDRKGVRVVVELKRDANAEVILNQLYRFTPLQTSFSIINLAIVEGKPLVCSLRQLIGYFVDHRRDVVRGAQVQPGKTSGDQLDRLAFVRRVRVGVQEAHRERFDARLHQRREHALVNLHFLHGDGKCARHHIPLQHLFVGRVIIAVFRRNVDAARRYILLGNFKLFGHGVSALGELVVGGFGGLQCFRPRQDLPGKHRTVRRHLLTRAATHRDDARRRIRQRQIRRLDLRRGGVAWNAADRLQADVDDRIARLLVREEIDLRPSPESRIRLLGRLESRAFYFKNLITTKYMLDLKTMKSALEQLEQERKIPKEKSTKRSK